MNWKLFLLRAAVGCFSFAMTYRAPGQGTAFTYQGQLSNGAGLANGSYNLTFRLYTNNTGGTAVGGPLTNNAISVTNGLFTVLLDFGSGVFNGAADWLEIGVETNGGGSFTTLAPRQELTPTPYAIYAHTSGNLSGSVSNSQLANSTITVNAGPGLTGGGVLALGGATTLSNTGLLSVTGNADITASTVNGAVALGDTATSAATANLLIKRDGTASFAAQNLTLQGDLNLPVTSGAAGIIYSGSALFMHAWGTQNLFAGAGAGNLTMSGTANTGVGWQALLSNSSGGEDTAVGTAALEFNTIGSQNTAIGNGVMEFNTSGSNNTACGYQALRNNTNGNANTAIGSQALYSNDDGSNNTAVGEQVLDANTGGWENTGLGYQALYHNTNGTWNTAEGAFALWWNTSGQDNTANGQAALNSNTTGSENTAVGLAALHSITTDSQNTAVGVDALDMAINGSDNIALGYQAGSLLQSGSNNIYIGNSGSDFDNSVVRIGYLQTNTFIAGISGATAASGVAVYVNASGQLGTLTSSARYKQDIRDMGRSSDALYALRPVTFKYQPALDPQGIPQFGLVAEDVEKVDSELVAHDAAGKPFTVRYQAIDAMLLNEFLKEHSQVERQAAQIEGLKQQNAALTKRLDELEAGLKAMAGKE